MLLVAINPPTCLYTCRMTADAPTTSEAASSSQTPVFDWNKQWYPVLPTSYAEADKPHGVTLLDRQFVVWRDGSGTWRAAEDFCPHRCAKVIAEQLWCLRQSVDAPVLVCVGSREGPQSHNSQP